MKENENRLTSTHISVFIGIELISTIVGSFLLFEGIVNQIPSKRITGIAIIALGGIIGGFCLLLPALFKRRSDRPVSLSRGEKELSTWPEALALLLIICVGIGLMFAVSGPNRPIYELGIAVGFLGVGAWLGYRISDKNGINFIQRCGRCLKAAGAEVTNRHWDVEVKYNGVKIHRAYMGPIHGVSREVLFIDLFKKKTWLSSKKYPYPNKFGEFVLNNEKIFFHITKGVEYWLKSPESARDLLDTLCAAFNKFEQEP